MPDWQPAYIKTLSGVLYSFQNRFLSFVFWLLKWPVKHPKMVKKREGLVNNTKLLSVIRSAHSSAADYVESARVGLHLSDVNCFAIRSYFWMTSPELGGKISPQNVFSSFSVFKLALYPIVIDKGGHSFAGRYHACVCTLQKEEVWILLGNQCPPVAFPFEMNSQAEASLHGARAHF